MECEKNGQLETYCHDIAHDEIAAAPTVLSVLLLDDGLEVVVDLTAHPHGLRER